MSDGLYTGIEDWSETRSFTTVARGYPHRSPSNGGKRLTMKMGS